MISRTHLFRKAGQGDSSSRVVKINTSLGLMAAGLAYLACSGAVADTVSQTPALMGFVLCSGVSDTLAEGQKFL